MHGEGRVNQQLEGQQQAALRAQLHLARMQAVMENGMFDVADVWAVLGDFGLVDPEWATTVKTSEARDSEWYVGKRVR